MFSWCNIQSRWCDLSKNRNCERCESMAFLWYIAGMIDPELWFAKRCIKFICMCMKYHNNTVKTISMMGVNGLYSVLGANYRVLSTKYSMNWNNIMKGWNERCANEEEIIRKCEQVRELCEMRDKCLTSILNKEESYTIIEFLCTY